VLDILRNPQPEAAKPEMTPTAAAQGE